MALRSSCLRCGAVCMGSLCPPHAKQAKAKRNRQPKASRLARGFNSEYDRNRKLTIDRAWFNKTPCIRCGQGFANKKDITCDHIVPRADGGGNEMGNLSVAHGACNSSAGGKMNKRRP